MAFYDDRKFLLSHIHHSFITSDDTGVCEEVMLNEVVKDSPLYKEEELQRPEMRILEFYSCSLDADLWEGGQSYDIVSDMELIGAHRLRSNTAQRLERLKREKQLQSQIKSVHWKENRNNIEESNVKELFPKKDLKKEKSEGPRKSALSEALEIHPSVPSNPFSEYSRFDGKITRVAQTKKIMIYLTMLPPGEREYPMAVVSLANAKVQDLIGLICWQYTNEKKEPQLKPDVSHYCLRIAEETGEVDEDFPSLDPKELVAKFGFPVLALVEKDPPLVLPSSITMRIEDEFTKLELPNLNVTLKEVVNQIRKRRKWLKRTTNFHVEKLNDAGIPLSLDSKISDIGCADFRLVIEDSTKREAIDDEWNQQQMALIEAPWYKSYNVLLTQKMGRNSDVQLGISDEKVEISPLPPKGAAAKILSRQQKPSTHFMSDVACCEIVSKKYSPGRTVFKIVYKTGQEFKNLVFEADNQTAQEIVKKVQIILDMKLNTARKDYQLYREKKLEKKKQQKTHSLPFP